MEIKYNDSDKLMKAGKFLESKGIDLKEYTIFDTSGNYKHQIPIATWLTDFAVLCGGEVGTVYRQLTIPGVSVSLCDIASTKHCYYSNKFGCENCNAKRRQIAPRFERGFDDF